MESNINNFKSVNKNNLLNLLFIIAFLIPLALFILRIFTPQEPCTPEVSKVKTVGGCDRYGYCSVMLENGEVKKDLHLPVVGEEISIRNCPKF